ncbi:aminoglycoside phosphotransferase family protein [Nitriliruptoraceae bacterium ZYF776]|nr:aminoglycoside phosphotransferase family protein [Profundirhabdus halotolerans]
MAPSVADRGAVGSTLDLQGRRRGGRRGRRGHPPGWLEADFDLHIVDAVPVDGGVDRDADLWRVRDAGGEDFAVKWTSGGTAGGLALTRALVDAGVEGVVAPLPAEGGQLWSQRGGRRLVVLPWVDAPPGLDTEPGELAWATFGRRLAAVHATPLAAVPDLPPSDRQHRRLAGAVAALHHDIDRALRTNNATAGHDDLVPAVLVDEALLRALVDGLLAGADDLHAAGSWAGHAPGVPCHADPHLGNLLVGKDGNTWLLDWDDAVVGPREQDLLFVLDGGVLAFAPVTASQTEAFFTGYGPVELDPHALAYHRSLRALEDLVDFALEVLHPEDHPRATREAAAGHLRANMTTGGLTEAALRSLHEVGALATIPTLRSPSA